MVYSTSKPPEKSTGYASSQLICIFAFSVLPAALLHLQGVPRDHLKHTPSLLYHTFSKLRESMLTSKSRKPDEEPKKPLLKVLTQLTPHENIYTIPNLLTFSRLVAAPVIGYLVLHDQHAWAVGLFVYAGLTDLVDGYIARRWNQQTVVGTVIDPMADKTLMTILTVCLAVKGALPGKLSMPSFLRPGPSSFSRCVSVAGCNHPRA
jgi:hypothetical protein